MKRVLSLAVVVALIVPFIAHAQAKPDFSGTWTLDPARSEPAGGGGGGRGGGGGGGGRGPAGPVVIKQTATDITIGMNTYKLDGSAVEIQGRGGVSKATAKWDGNKLVITTTGDAGGTPFTTTQTRSLSADGKEMTVEGSGGRGPTKQVYTKS
jgi:hypothetical protein